MYKLLFITAGLIALSACTEARYYQGVIHEVAAEAKDMEAETLRKAACLTGLGAFFRIVDPREQMGLVMLCGKGQTMPEPLPLPEMS